MSPLMLWRVRVTRVLELLCYAIAGLTLTVMLLTSVFDVLLRKSVGISVRGVVDIVGFCVVVSTMFGIALAWSKRGHIVVDLLDMTGSPMVLAFLDVFNRVVGVLLMPLLAWLAWREMRDVYGFGDTSPDIALPLWWFWLSIVAGYLLSAILVLIAPTRHTGGTNV